MRVTEKGQVTIPKDIRERLDIKPGSEVDFIVDGDAVHLVKASPELEAEKRRKRVEAWVERVRGTADLNGMDGKEYIDWLRGERDDLNAG